MTTRVALICNIVLVATMFGMSAWAWSVLPSDRPIPVHWDINGSPDRYGGKGEALLLTPLMAVILSGVLAVLPRFGPRQKNVLRAGAAYPTIWVAVIAFLAAVHVVLVSTTLGTPLDIMVFLPAAIGLLFVVIGAQLGHTYSNYFVGIRTPWTLSSDLSWSETHRVGGRAFIALGALLILAGMLRNPILLLVTLVGIMPIMIVALIAYSYVVWKRDPDRGRTSAA